MNPIICIFNRYFLGISFNSDCVIYVFIACNSLTSCFFLWNHTNWIFFFPFLILLSMMCKATQVNVWILQSIYRMIDTYFATSEAGNVMHSLRSLAFLWQLLNSGECLEQQKSFGCFWNPGYPTVGNHSSFADDTDLLPFKDEACCFFGGNF